MQSFCVPDCKRGARFSEFVVICGILQAADDDMQLHLTKQKNSHTHRHTPCNCIRNIQHFEKLLI